MRKTATPRENRGAAAIGPAVSQGLRHRKEGRLAGAAAVTVENSGNSTHGWGSITSPEWKRGARLNKREARRARATVMEDLLIGPLVLLAGIGIHLAVSRSFDPREARLLNFSFAAHMVSGVAQILVYSLYYGSGDMTAYRDFSIPIAEALRYDFEGIFPGTVTLLFQRADITTLPFETPMGGGSTGSMTAISAYLFFLLGNSFYGVTLTIAVLAYVSKVLIYRAFKPEFPPEQHRVLLIAIALIPSGVFWSAALLKEPIVMIFMGPLFLGFRLIVRSRPLAGIPLVLFGAIGVALFKAYILLSFGLAAAVWLVWARVIRDRGSSAVKPFYLVGGVLIGLLLLTIAERYFFKRDDGGIAASMASQRRVSGKVEGGSNYSLEGDTSDIDPGSTSLAGELALSPVALVTSLYRPFIFEVRKPMQLLNALETTWMLWASIRIFKRNRLKGLVNKITASPALMFCFVFTIVVGLGTGLSTSNLGALSRYRAPMVPFYALLLLTLLPARELTAQERALQALPPQVA